MKNEKMQLVEIEKSSFAVELLKDNVHVNLTQMAKEFGKKPETWLKTNESKEYIEAVSDALKSASADLVQVRKGGASDNQGTWTTDKRIAIRFAQWLSPHFSIMVDEHLIKLLDEQNGKPKQVEQNGTYKEGDVFLSKLGTDTVHGHYHKGEFWFSLSGIARFIGHKHTSGKSYATKFGEGLSVLVENGARSFWAVNRRWVDQFVLQTSTPIPNDKLATLYRDLFLVEREKGNAQSEYDYLFTEGQVSSIIKKLSRIKGNSTLVHEIIGEVMNGWVEQ